MSPKRQQSATPDCWICGGDGAPSREHTIKQSDLRAAFSKPSQSKPLFLHTAARRNQRVGSFKADRLKFKTPICEECNTTRTQPHDRAWERYAGVLQMLAPNDHRRIRGNRVFSYDTTAGMRAMHLYFVKLMGCMMMDAGVDFDVASFSRAIMTDRAHPRLYLRFGRSDMGIGGSDLELDRDAATNEIAFASYFHYLGGFAANIILARADQRRDGLIGAWHPRFRNNVTFQTARAFETASASP